MPQTVHDPSLVGPLGGSISHECLQSDSGSSATSSTTSSMTAVAVVTAAFVFAVAFAAVLLFAAALLTVLPEVDADFFVANGRSSQLLCPP